MEKNPLATFKKGVPVLQCARCEFWTELLSEQLEWKSKELLQP